MSVASFAPEKSSVTVPVGTIDFGHFHHAAYTIGAAYALMDQPREAVRWLRAAADDGQPNYPLFERDRTLDKLRGDVEFRQLMAEMRRGWERYKAIS